ncbi:hypothetical protein ACOMHN_052282 [Nucella lapillus]
MASIECHCARVCVLILTCTIIVMCSGKQPEEQPVEKQGKENILQRGLHLEDSVSANVTEAAQQRLLQIYRESISPLEQAFHFTNLNRDAISEGDMLAKPMILFVGPWSTGKSTIINYLLNNEQSNWKLHTGAEPTTSDFTVVTHGAEQRLVKGIQLVSDKTKHYIPLHKFGLNFVERFHGMEFPSPLLERVTLVDTPGIIENKKQQARGYPFNEVCQWFIDRAHLIFLVFDPSKLDIGSELEILFDQLKGHQAKLRLILNKADTVTTQELMRVYGALFWSLAPLVNEVEPPRVYVSSLRSEAYRPATMHSLFQEEEMSLLTDITQMLRYQLEYKIAATRRHAVLVRLHALMVEAYRKAFTQSQPVFGSGDNVWADILSDPDRFSVYNLILQNADMSVHDLPTPATYETFFSRNNLANFKPLSHYCAFWGKCDMELLLNAINVELPNLLQELRSGKITSGKCSNDKC